MSKRKMHTSFTASAEFFDFEVRATVNPEIPGNYHGRPEDCFPDESAEVDEVHVFYEGEEIGGKLGDYLISLVSEEDIIGHAEDNDKDSRDEAAAQAHEDRYYDRVSGL